MLLESLALLCLKCRVFGGVPGACGGKDITFYTGHKQARSPGKDITFYTEHKQGRSPGKDIIFYTGHIQTRSPRDWSTRDEESSLRIHGERNSWQRPVLGLGFYSETHLEGSVGACREPWGECRVWSEEVSDGAYHLYQPLKILEGFPVIIVSSCCLFFPLSVMSETFSISWWPLLCWTNQITERK